VESNELSALMNLLDDPDQEVYRHVQNKLVSLGPSIIPSLESFWENSFDPVLHERIEDLIHQIQFNLVCQDLKEWSASSHQNLLQGAILVARYQYPELDSQKIISQVERLRKEIWLEMNYNLTPLEQVNVFNHVLFSLHNFSPNTINIHDPQNAYLNILLETKKGNPISLGILYLVLGQSLKMPVLGVNLPQHFVVSYHKNMLAGSESEQEVRSGVLFYINPFNKGIIFSREDISLFLKKLKLENQPEFYLPCDNRIIINQLITSLIHSYELAGVALKVRELSYLRELIGTAA